MFDSKCSVPGSKGSGWRAENSHGVPIRVPDPRSSAPARPRFGPLGADQVPRAFWPRVLAAPSGRTSRSSPLAAGALARPAETRAARRSPRSEVQARGITQPLRGLADAGALGRVDAPGSPEDQRSHIDQRTEDVLERLYSESPGSRDQVASAAGYAVFSNIGVDALFVGGGGCLLYTSPSPRDQRGSRMPSSA